ncbi:MAG: class I SAM-dependent methyltransferase [Thermotogota bacterium]|nr:class I SAM-dependent methyltransferase [Thermotogota bacterium]
MNKWWNWNRVKEDIWNRPSEDVYYLLHRWKEKGYKRFLDLGCGMGRHSIFFAENGFQVTGYDLSESGLRILKESVEENNLNIDIVKGDITSLPFDNEIYDSILSCHSIYHVDSEGMCKVIEEISRVLKKGGEIFLTLLSKRTFSYTAPDSVMVSENVRLKKEEEVNIFPHYYVDYDDIKRLFKEFDIISIRQIEDYLDEKSSYRYFLLLRK